MTSKKLIDAMYYEQNKESLNARKAIRYAENREKIRARQAEYYQKNKALFAKKVAKRHAAKLNRTPSWLTKAHYAEIDGFYDFCQIFNTYIHDKKSKFEVDHIIPLQGKQVSGLHTPENLQILSCRENVVKRNTFNPDVYPRQGDLSE